MTTERRSMGSEGLTADDVRGLNDAARTLIEQLDRHGLGNLALFEQQVAHLRGHLLSVAALAAQPAAGEGLTAALTTALSVVLHEELDPGCTGDPPYSDTHERAAILAEIVMATPIVLAALQPASEPQSKNESEVPEHG